MPNQILPQKLSDINSDYLGEAFGRNQRIFETADGRRLTQIRNKRETADPDAIGIGGFNSQVAAFLCALCALAVNLS